MDNKKIKKLELAVYVLIAVSVGLIFALVYRSNPINLNPLSDTKSISCELDSSNSNANTMDFIKIT